MYLWEIPKGDRIVVSFDLGKRHYDFNTELIPIKCREANSIYTEPIVVSGKIMRVDSKFKNITIRYLNRRSGRTHTWDDVTIRYEQPPKNLYVVTCENDSVQINRRRAIRISVNKKTECKISLLEGNYKCTINDISVTGIGINIDVALANRNLFHRTIYTHFTDVNLGKRFEIEARCLHCTQIDAKVVRCGCEIISVNPPINEYINAKQLQNLAKSANRSELEETDIFYESEPSSRAEEKKAQEEKPAAEENEMDNWTSKPEDQLILGEGELCPVCEKGRLHRSLGYFLCDSCGSMLD
ncbi:MAG: PilZ domain-containing protein [Lachnospiraceae bacterium]|nr:PilZ domain-containing protein [Lachnospiraceae bacterium]